MCLERNIHRFLKHACNESVPLRDCERLLFFLCSLEGTRPDRGEGEGGPGAGAGEGGRKGFVLSRGVQTVLEHVKPDLSGAKQSAYRLVDRVFLEVAAIFEYFAY